MNPSTGTSARIGAGLGLLAFVLSCTGPTEVSNADLAQIVERDGVPFVVPTIPDVVVDRLAAHRVVIVGETHMIREHHELMSELIPLLHARGFRQILFEWPHLADWLLTDFVQDGQLEPQWAPPTLLSGPIITAIRDLNRTVPEAARMHVRAIDVNLSDYGGAREFVNSSRALSLHLDDPGPITAFLQGSYATTEQQLAKLEILLAELEVDRPNLVGAWGEYLYETVAEMVEVEIASVIVRGQREDHYDLSVRLREDVMKRLADLRLGGTEHGTLINVGGNHAQKEFLKGTSQEWLGDYLVHKSNATGGSVIVLNVVPARGEPGTGGGIADFDVLDASPENEIFRVMNETWPDEIVFLPLDDPVFMEGGVLANFEGTIYTSAPKRHYDIFVLLPVAHRVN